MFTIRMRKQKIDSETGIPLSKFDDERKSRKRDLTEEFITLQEITWTKEHQAKANEDPEV